MKRKLESGLYKAILDWTKFQTNLVLWRQNSGVARFGNERQRYVSFTRAGAADLTGLVFGGRRLEIEVKMPGQKLTATQEIFRNDVLKFGGIYIVVHSVEELRQKLAAFGVMTK